MASGKGTTASKRKRSRAKAPALPPCQVEGCGKPGLEQIEGPAGKVVLCVGCAKLARASLKDAEARAEILDIAAAPMQKVIAKQQLRDMQRAHRATAAGGVLLG